MRNRSISVVGNSDKITQMKTKMCGAKGVVGNQWVKYTQAATTTTTKQF